MTILVISDTHKDLKHARLAIKHTMETGLEMVIHCGDHIDGTNIVINISAKVLDV